MKDPQRTARLLHLPVAGVFPIPVPEANRLLVEWDHKLGPCNRPFHQEAWGIEWNDRIIAVAISASIIHGPVAGYETRQCVELARLAACEPWANRLMIRLWRETCAQLWPCWKVRGAVSYSHNAMHKGDLYRFDGWRKVKEDAGFTSGANWGRDRYAGTVHKGKKTLWAWDFGLE